MAKQNKAQKFGIFYKSHGRWIGPYLGVTFSEYSSKRNPLKDDINYWKNYTLKSKVKLMPVQ